MKSSVRKILLISSLFMGLIFNFCAYADTINVCLENDWGTLLKLCVGGCTGTCTDEVATFFERSNTITVNNPSTAIICDNHNNTGGDVVTISSSGLYKALATSDGFYEPDFNGSSC